MISLSGLGAVYPGYQAGQANLLALAQKQAEQDAQTAYGQALQALAGQSGIPLAPQLPTTRQGLGAPIAPPPPSQGPMTLAPPQNPGRVPSAADFGLQNPGRVPSAADFGLTPQGPTVQQSVAATQAKPPIPSAAQAPAAGGSPAAAQSQVNLPPTTGVQPGTLTWPAIVNAIKAANPKISPAALAGAVSSMLPLMQNEQAQQWKAIEARQAQQRLAQGRAGNISSGYEADPDNPGGWRPIPGGPADTDIQNVKTMVAGWIDGTIPVPSLSAVNSTTKSMMAAKAEAKRQGFDLTEAARAVTADSAFLRAMNSGPQMRMRESIGTVEDTLNTLQETVDAWDAGQFPALNARVREAAKAGALGPEANRIANDLDVQIADVRTVLASAIMGGNTPTDRAFQFAKDQLDPNWSRATLDSAMNLARRNLNSRKQAMNSVQPVGLPSSVQSPSSGGAGQLAPDGTVVQMQDGSYQIKQGGKWVPYQ